MPAHTDHFLFEITGLSSELRVARFSGHEAVSDLFHFEVVVVSEDPAIAFADTVGKTALLTLLGGAEPRYVHGIVSRFEQGDAGKKITAYRVTVVPRAWRLLHRHDCRIFQEKSTPDIVKAVLEGAGLASGDDFAFHLRGTYPPREYCVEWRESDWAFICRLLEDEGIFYYFEHHADKHVLVFADQAGAHEPISGDATISYRQPLGAMVQGEHVHRIHVSEEARTGKIDVRDYDWKKPDRKLEGDKAASLESDLPIYDWMNADVEHDAAGRAAVRLDERRSLRRVGRGESGCERMVAGYTFTLSEHPREDFNASYILARVEHEGIEPALGEASAMGETRYENRFACVPAAIPLRPPLVTPRPTIRGLQTAMVTGPSGEEIHTDEHGRIKVQFQWDRLGKKDDKTSCWIRVGQTWAGPGWGALYIPRIGQEVLVDFLDGNPDRPVVVGTVYHGTNTPPYPLPGEKTKSTLKSNSTPGGGGFNEFRFEDKKGSEEIFLHGQKDWNIQILHDKNQNVGHDETRQVGNDRTLQVGNNQKESIGNDELFAIANDRTKSVGRDETESIGRDRTISVKRDHTESIGQNLTLSVAKVRAEEIGEDSSETTGKAKNLTVGTDYTIAVTGAMSTTVDGSQTLDVKDSRSVTVAEKITITVGSAKVTIEKSGDVKVEGANLSVKASGDVQVESSGKVAVKASGDVTVEASGKVAVKSSGATDVNASGPVKVKGANVAIN